MKHYFILNWWWNDENIIELFFNYENIIDCWCRCPSSGPCLTEPWWTERSCRAWWGPPLSTPPGLRGAGCPFIRWVFYWILKIQVIFFIVPLLGDFFYCFSKNWVIFLKLFFLNSWKIRWVFFTALLKGNFFFLDA